MEPTTWHGKPDLMGGSFSITPIANKMEALAESTAVQESARKPRPRKSTITSEPSYESELPLPLGEHSLLSSKNQPTKLSKQLKT